MNWKLQILSSRPSSRLQQAFRRIYQFLCKNSRTQWHVLREVSMFLYGPVPFKEIFIGMREMMLLTGE